MVLLLNVEKEKENMDCDWDLRGKRCENGYAIVDWVIEKD